MTTLNIPEWMQVQQAEEGHLTFSFSLPGYPAQEVPHAAETVAESFDSFVETAVSLLLQQKFSVKPSYPSPGMAPEDFAKPAASEVVKALRAELMGAPRRPVTVGA